jgi:AcrR family transcriptional regulator
MTSVALEKGLRPRKTPRQVRSAATRARILDAAREVFAAYGYAAGTTNRIAATAGVSVGSLYQYFPNKDSILVELVRDHVRSGTEATLAVVPSTIDAADLPATVRGVVSAMVEVHAGDRRLHQVLFEEAPRPSSLLEELRDLEDHAVAIVSALLVHAYPTADDVPLRARIVVVTIESLVHRFVASDRPLDTGQFVDEVAQMVLAYLTATFAATA